MRISYRCPHCENNGYRTFGAIGITERVEYDDTEDRGIRFPIYESGKDLRERRHSNRSPFERPQPKPDEDHSEETETEPEPEKDPFEEQSFRARVEAVHSINSRTPGLTVKLSHKSKTHEKENNDASSEL